MIKYNKDLVKRYINGDDIDEYSLDELENDFNFMQQVIETTNDKNVFFLCSDELKDNIEFIKYIINKFSKDKKFIIEVADNYISDKLLYVDNNEEYNIEVTEINMLMSNILRKDNDNIDKYSIRIACEYGKLRTGIEEMKLNPENDSINIGMGFIIMKLVYNGNQTILDSFSKRLIEEIMVNDDIEKNLHRKYYKKNDVTKIGINTLIINYISEYDQELANYIITDLSIIKGLTDIVGKILYNWDRYNKQEEDRIYDLILDKYFNYFEKDNHSTIDSITLLYYIGRQLNIEDKLKEYNQDLENRFGYDDLTDEQIKLSLKNSMANKKAYHVNLKMIKSVLNNTYIEEDSYIIDEESKKLCKIVDFNNRKVNN